MFSRPRKLLSFSAIAAAVAFAALSQTPTFAAKPGGGGNGGGSTGGGTIYFVSGSFGQMNSDGSEKTPLPVPAGEPSRQLHAGHRWFVRGAVVAGFYPNGDQRYELFAYRDDGVVVPLTNDADLQPGVGRGIGYGADDVRWQPGETRISWVAQRWDSARGVVVEAGIYQAALAYDALGNLTGIAPGSVALLLPTPDVGTHDWSPDGSRIVYDLLSTRELRIADLVSGDVTLLYAGPAYRPVWSPAGSAIAFQESVYRGDIMTIKPDGTSLKTVIRSQGRSHSQPTVWGPSWSPTGSHLVYEQYTINNWIITSYVYRARADGSASVNLTPESSNAVPLAWR
jgi:hypothetical protein